jgi:hypothetical protein
VAALIVIGTLLVLSSIALLIWQDAVMRRVTSRPLGSLAPGYAATRVGYRAYVGLVLDVGVVAVSIGLATVWLIVASIALFLFGTLVVIYGEVVVYRDTKR